MDPNPIRVMFMISASIFHKSYRTRKKFMTTHALITTERAIFQ